MIVSVLRFALAASLLCLLSCHTMPPPAIDSEVASAIPSSTTLLAGIDLDHLRASPLYAKLPPSFTVALETYREAQSVLLTWDGRGIVFLARGRFREAPAGSTLLASRVAVAGDPQGVTAAVAQHKTGHPGAPDLLSLAQSLASENPVWIVARGGTPLPFTGNAANLNRLLRNTESSSLTLRLDSQIQLTATILGRTADAAREVEQTLRAAITMAGAAEARQSEMAALLKSIRLTRDDRTVRAALSANPDSAQKLFRALAP